MKLNPQQREALELVASGGFYPALVEERGSWYARWRSVEPVSADVDRWVDEAVRRANLTILSADADRDRHATLHDAWLAALKSRNGLVVWPAEECRRFSRTLDEWSLPLRNRRDRAAGIAFAFSAAGEVSCNLPRGREGLQALGEAARLWTPLAGLKPRGRGELAVVLTAREVEDFLHRGSRLLIQAGYAVQGVELRSDIVAYAEMSAAAAKDESPKLSVRIKVAGEEVTAAEVRFLLEQGATTVFFRDHWIEVDRNLLKQALRALERGAGEKANLLSFAMGIGCIGKLEIEELKTHGWVRGLVNQLRSRGSGNLAANGPKAIAGFRGKLRDYQRHGVEWLEFMTGHGFGALLADDMGLGKTIQTIAWLCRQPSPRRALIVAPLTLLANWRHELAKFAPKLTVYVHQGDSRHLVDGFRAAAEGSEITLTSYNLLVREYDAFSGIAWNAIILDEAQAVKNPLTQAARAIRALTPRCRIMLTGTPVENSLLDLWALEDFLNPGFLDDRNGFRDRFVKPIASDPNSRAAERLRHALEPFVMRRLKTEPAIAAELGEKREVREYCVLTEAERREYESALAAFRVSEHSQGDVFALLTELKLICDGVGKLERLCDLLESIFASGESALVFTQYAKVGVRLQKELEKRFARRFPFLHGSLTARERETEIARFNEGGANAFLLSLKAGGFGLNLTKATHVIHFDRWWNPAVEEQATDRAHRIGQSKDVFVHLMITEGTLEEHIDAMLERKLNLKRIIADSSSFWQAVSLTETGGKGGR